jgi:hypothetical protein
VSARTIVVVTAIAVVAGVATLAYSSSRAPAAMLGVVVSPRNAALDVSNQRSAAERLIVGRVLAPGPSWVVVTTADAAGSGAIVVGMTHLPAGESRAVEVGLDESVGLFGRVTVALHADRGVIGRFEFDPARFEASPDKPYFVNGSELATSVVKDTIVSPLAVAAGAGISAEPTAAEGSALDIANRLTVIDELAVDRVVAPRPSWVAVYLVNDDGTPGALAGVVRVARGEHMNVLIPVRTQQSLTPKLLVALQADLGVAGKFEFDPEAFGSSPDKPYAYGGAEMSREVLLRGYGMDNDNILGPAGSGM